MRRLVRLVALGLLLWGWPGLAWAHSLLEGVGDFYAGLLHPILVPAESLALLTVALLAGTAGQVATRRSLLALAGGIAGGLLVAQFLPSTWAVTSPLLAVVVVAAAVVVAGIAVSPPAAALAAGALGFLIGVDARPEPATVGSMLAASVATVIGGTVVGTVVAAFVLGRKQQWQRVAVRVAASWITAIAVLYLGWLALRSSG